MVTFGVSCLQGAQQPQQSEKSQILSILVGWFFLLQNDEGGSALGPLSAPRRFYSGWQSCDVSPISVRSSALNGGCVYLRNNITEECAPAHKGCPTPLLPGIGRSCTGTCPSMLWGHAGACLAHIPLCSGFPFVEMGARARRDCAWAGCPWGTGTGRLSCPMWWKSLTQGGHLLSSQPTAGEKVAPVLQVASGLVIP